tara:strand:- start:1706 stop:2329 length:624 start_codon:yes stop_codon:yes gene_type:complete
MDYKNLLLRSSVGIIILLIYIILNVTNFHYIYYFIIILYLLFLIEILFFFQKYKYLFAIYLFFSFLIFNLLDFKEINIFNFNLMIIVIITFDIFSYLIGSNYGKTGFTKLSPKKTIEGLVGGIILSNSFSTFVILIFQKTYTFDFLIFINSIIIFSLLGDLIESFFKRKNHLKNSSFFLPGHGGFLDRFDSFIFAIIPYYFLENYIL